MTAADRPRRELYTEHRPALKLLYSFAWHLYQQSATTSGPALATRTKRAPKTLVGHYSVIMVYFDSEAL